jgi:hypothetical protein
VTAKQKKGIACLIIIVLMVVGFACVNILALFMGFAIFGAAAVGEMVMECINLIRGKDVKNDS